MKKLFLLSTLLIFGFSAYTEADNHTSNSPVTDAGVLIGGVRWATRNVDAPGTFTKNPEDAGKFFQWNKRQGWAITGDVVGWDRTPATGAEWERVNNPCPPNWRVPTMEELTALRDAGSEWVTINDVNGRRFGSGENSLFLPAIANRNVNGTSIRSLTGTDEDNGIGIN